MKTGWVACGEQNESGLFCLLFLPWNRSIHALYQMAYHFGMGYDVCKHWQAM